MFLSNFIDFCKNIFIDGTTVGGWFTTSIDIGSVHITPLLLLTAGGLITYLTIAIGKWLIS